MASPVIRKRSSGKTSRAWQVWIPEAAIKGFGPTVVDVVRLEFQDLAMPPDLIRFELSPAQAERQQPPQLHVFVIDERQELLELDPTVIGAVRVAVHEFGMVIFGLLARLRGGGPTMASL
jgi:hypothetical protein